VSGKNCICFGIIILLKLNERKSAALLAVYVSCNCEGHYCKHCCIAKAISITYSEYVSIAIVIQDAMGMRHIVMCGLPCCTLFFNIIVRR
jgi:hypothetical protein